MSGLDMLDVAIGMIFVFLLLSLICSALTEMIEAFMKQRAFELEKGIREMLVGAKSLPAARAALEAAEKALEEAIHEKKTSEVPLLTAKVKEAEKVVKNADLVRQIYSHPLISSLYEGDYDTAKKRVNVEMQKLEWHGTLPSYIPANNFVAALIDVLSQPDPNDPNKKLLSLANLKDSVKGMDDTKIKEALQAIINQADDQVIVIKNDLKVLKDGIEKWYDSTMDRVTSFYKRRVQYFTLLLGLIVAVVLNVDTIAVTNRLVYDPALRSALVASALDTKAHPASTQTSSNETPGGGSAPPAKPDAANSNTANAPVNANTNAGANAQKTPVASAANSNVSNVAGNVANNATNNKTEAKNPCVANTNSDACKEFDKKEAAELAKCEDNPKADGCNSRLCGNSPNSAKCKVAKACDGDSKSNRCNLAVDLYEIKSLGLPIGWTGFNYNLGWDWIFKVIGWLITAIAISLGAPFWFDLLKQFMNIRSSIKPNDKEADS
ncbi:MAG TPA: hypothetical protein VGO50_15790 [Pyrinomonadaceae bacterium]|jgi:hypothetical protein|nr:hypothetical protein [Pyrinomonadaceae bacterium]